MHKQRQAPARSTLSRPIRFSSMSRNTLSKIIFTVLASGALFASSVAFAQTNIPATTSSAAFKPLLVFPIAELGGCASKEACKAYCDVAANKDACFAYAQTHGLMTRDQIVLAKKLLAQVGPGGCKGEECKLYCQDQMHEQVCLEFARINGFISKEDAARRIEKMNIASTTRQVPPIPTNATGTIGTTTNANMPPLKRPPPPNERVIRQGSSTPQQSSSVWLGILHFFGR